MTDAGNKPSDPTFRSYSSLQAKHYSESRLSYASELYTKVLRYHAETGGSFDTVLDVGCGPGNATRDLALSFNNAVGIDPGVEMIESARQLGGVTLKEQPIRFQVAAAEACASVKEVANGVDILVAAMAVSS